MTSVRNQTNESTPAGVRTPPGRSSFVQTFGTSLGLQIFSVVSGVLVARALGPDGRGVFAAAQIWPIFIAGLFFFGSNQALSLRAADHRSERGALYGAALGLGCGLSVAALFVAALAIPLLLEDSEVRSSALLFLPQIPLFILVSLLVSVDVGLGNFGRYNLSRWALGVTNFAAVLSLVLAGVDEPSAFLFALLVANGVCLLTLLFRLDWRAVRLCSPHLRVVIEGGRFYAATIALLLRDQIERLFLLYAMSVDDLGQYVVAFSAAFLPSVLAKSLGLIVFSRSAIIGRSGAYEDTGRLFRLLVTVNLIIAAGSAAVLPFLLPFIYGPAFAPAGQISLVLVLAQVAIAAFSVLDEGLKGQDRAHLGAVAILLMLVTFLATAFQLANTLGALGVAVAAVVGHTVSLLFLVVIFKRTAPEVPLLPRREELQLLANIARGYVGKLPVLRSILARLP